MDAKYNRPTVKVKTLLLDCICDENRGSSRGCEQADPVAYTVRDFLPQRLHTLT